MCQSNSFLIELIGDLNAKSKNWYSHDKSSHEGNEIENLTAQFALQKIIKETTHLSNTSSSCIDLMFTSQPDLITDFGVHSSLHSNRHHQIVFTKFNLHIVYPPPYLREIWHYRGANTGLLMLSMMTTDVINDITSLVPLSPINLLTMKSRIVMPPPDVFTSHDMYCRKHWRRVQHLSNEFWSRWRKEVLLTLQKRQKWNDKTRNCEIGDLVLIKNDMERNSWPMAKVVVVDKDDQSRYLEQPVNKLFVLVEKKDEVDGSIPRREAGT